MMKRLAACGAPSQLAGGNRSYADTEVAMLLLGSLHDDYSTSLPASKNHQRFPQQTLTTCSNNRNCPITIPLNTVSEKPRNISCAALGCCNSRHHGYRPGNFWLHHYDH